MRASIDGVYRPTAATSATESYSYVVLAAAFGCCQYCGYAATLYGSDSGVGGCCGDVDRGAWGPWALYSVLATSPGLGRVIVVVGVAAAIAGC